MNDTISAGDSLVAAIAGNYEGMAHRDLVLTCQMLERGRAAWRDDAERMERELNEIHALLDDDESEIIRNAKDGYPDGRQDRILTLK